MNPTSTTPETVYLKRSRENAPLAQMCEFTARQLWQKIMREADPQTHAMLKMVFALNQLNDALTPHTPNLVCETVPEIYARLMEASKMLAEDVM